jgi:hypothetical protein
MKSKAGPLKLPLMFIQKIADFRPPKWPYPCPGIVDFRSGKAEPCLDIADFRLDRPQAKFFFCDMQTASSVWYMSIQNRGCQKFDLMKSLLRAAVNDASRQTMPYGRLKRNNFPPHPS